MTRGAMRADLGEVLEIQAAWPALPQWTLRQFDEELQSETGRLVVWEDGQLVTGYGCVRWLGPEAEVLMVAVDPRRARKGIGSRLLARLHAVAIEQGCVTCDLEVSAANAGALRLYERAGYRVVGRRPKYYTDGSDALLMSIPLP